MLRENGLLPEDYSSSNVPEVYVGMLKEINNFLPEIARASEIFSKTHTQFFDTVHVISHPTPLRNLRQIMAEIDQIKRAISHASFSFKKKRLEADIKEKQAKQEEDELKKEMLLLEAKELLAQIAADSPAYHAAIRRLRNFQVQYEQIKEKHNIGKYTEKDIELEEEEYGIKTAFTQALCAAYSRNGSVDEGNFIYFVKLGINPAHAQHLICEFITSQVGMLKKGIYPSYLNIETFLNKCATTFRGCSKLKCDVVGISQYSSESLNDKA